MAHAANLIITLETEVEQFEQEWRQNEEYHRDLYVRYLNLQDILYTTNRRFQTIPAFHNLRNFDEVRRARVATSNLACGSGTGKRPSTDQDQGGTSKKSKDDAADEQYTSDTIQLRPAGYRHVKLFGYTSKQYAMQLRNLENVEDIEGHVENGFNEALAHFRTRTGIGQNDQVGVEVDYPGLRQNDPVLVHFRQLNTLDGLVIMRAISRVLQSYQSINIGEPATITFTHLTTPSGGGRSKVGLQLMTQPKACTEHYNQKNGHLLALGLKDQLCLPKCILLAQSKHNTLLYIVMRDTRKLNTGQFVEQAKALLRRAGIEHDGPCSLFDVRKLQEVVPERILIFDRDRALTCIWGANNDPTKLDDRARGRIMLQLDEGHYDLIQSLPAFLGKRGFCFDCMKAIRKLHRCTAQCTFCRVRSVTNCEPDGTKTTCDECNRWFKSRVCFENHKLVLGEKKPACALIKNCIKCGYRITTNNKHYCHTRYCGVCSKRVKMGPHVCYIQKIKKPDPEKDTGICKEIFCDFESCFETVGGKELHKPIFACAQVQCSQCTANWSRDITCLLCKEPPEQTFMGPNTIDEFCRWLFADNHKHAVAVFHNFKGYDGQFITEWASTVPNVEFDLIPRGMGILQLTCNYVRVICSMSYLSVALRKLPAMFKFDHEVMKGEFPYRLLTDVDQLSNDPIPWPALELYDPDRRSASDRAALLTWYETVKDGLFHTLDQLTVYCKMDVTILRKAMSMFRDMFIANAGVHPYATAFTIASACMQSYKMNNMPADTLMIHKESGPRRTSKKSMRWLALREHDDNIRLRTSRSTHGEYRLQCGLRKFVADGVALDGAGAVTHIYEFYGCYWHACRNCYAHCEESNWMGDEGVTFREKNDETIERMSIIRQFYPQAVIIEMWEHQFDELAKTPRVARFLADLPYKEPIDPRNALKGGRVEVCQLRGQSTDPTTAAGYNDVAFPVGEYEVILNASVDMMRTASGGYHVPWFGLMQVKLLATKRLYHSPIPYNTPAPDKKLVFPLCATCAIEQSNTCAHTVEERAWWTTLCTIEVQLAFDHGFQPLAIGEVWHFKNKMQFDPDKKGSGLFSDYITSWLCKKVEASGYPASCKTDEEKAQFISDYETKQHVTLDPDNMEFNAPMRATAKLSINNLWGKLCQRNNQPKTSYFKRSQLSEYHNLVLDPNKTKTAVVPMNDKCICVIHKNNEEIGEPSRSQSIVIGVLVTAYDMI